MAASDAKPIPKKNQAYRQYFFMRNADGTLLATAWTGADTEISKDGAAFADATGEAVQIGTSGVGYIDLTAAEMNADAVILKITLTNAGVVPLVLPLYTVENGDIPADITTVNGAASTVLNDTYQALIWYTDSDSNTLDRYGVTWLKNGVPVAVTAPTIQVIRVEGTLSVVPETSMSQVGTQPAYYYFEGTNRMVDGQTYLIVVTATIDGGTRTFQQFMSRDSAV